MPSAATDSAYTPSYHSDKESPYALPNDAPEHDRLEVQARHLSNILNGQIIHNPILPPGKPDMTMLDVGCGTGIVTDVLGKRFPDANVFGLDLSPIPQRKEARPENVKFLQGNVITQRPTQWTSSPFGEKEEAVFDLIFSRLLVCGLPDWDAYIRRAYQMLKPGGYLEIHDMDWVWYKNHSSDPKDIISNSWPWWIEHVAPAGEAKGLDWKCASNAAQRMRDAGFVDVKVEKYRWPWGGQWEKHPVWKEFGEYVHEEMVRLVWHMIPRLVKDAGDEEMARLREEMVRDLRPEEGKVWWMYVTVGRKPE